jgi:hypothetical protein
MPTATQTKPRTLRHPVGAFVESAYNGGQMTGKDLGEQVLRKPEVFLPKVVNLLRHDSAKVRAGAAEALAEVLQKKPTAGVRHVAELLAALDCKEAQTRAEVLKSLAAMTPHCATEMWSGFDKLRANLLEPKSATIRQYAALCLAHLGERGLWQARKVLPLFAEALQTFSDDAQIVQALRLIARESFAKRLAAELQILLEPVTQRKRSVAKQQAEKVLALLSE